MHILQTEVFEIKQYVYSIKTHSGVVKVKISNQVVNNYEITISVDMSFEETGEVIGPVNDYRLYEKIINFLCIKF